MTQVRGIKLARLGRQPAWQVGIADDRYAFTDDHSIRFSQFAVATLLRSKVDDNATVFHCCDHVGRDKSWRRLARNQCGRDDNVDVFSLLGKKRHFRLDELVAHHLCIAAFTATFLTLEFEHQEICIHAFDLLLDLRARVEGTNDRAHAPRCANRREACNTGTDDEDLGRRHFARCGDLPGKEAAEVLRRLDDRPVTGDIGHRTQRIHFLRPRDTRHAIHRHRRRPAACQLLE